MATVNAGTSSKRAQIKPNSDGLHIEPQFCPVGVKDPFDTVDWEKRSAEIKGENGDVLFEQTDCEIPASWSQLATNVVVSKYFTAKSEPTNGKTVSGSSSIALPGQSPTGDLKTAILPVSRTVNAFIEI